MAKAHTDLQKYAAKLRPRLRNRIAAVEARRLTNGAEGGDLRFIRGNVTSRRIVADELFEFAQKRYQEWRASRSPDLDPPEWDKPGADEPHHWNSSNAGNMSNTMRLFLAGSSPWRRKPLEVLELYLDYKDAVDAAMDEAAITALENAARNEDEADNRHFGETAGEPIKFTAGMEPEWRTVVALNTIISPDPELAAMETVYKALEPLDKGSRERVLNYLADRFNVEVLV